MGKLYSALIILSLIWGTSFLFIKILLESMDPSAVVFGRSLFGAVTLLVVALFIRNKGVFTNIPWKMLILVSLLNNALPWFLISSSETKISSGLASIINATTPIWTLLIGFLFFSSSLKKNQWIGVLVGFVGIFILSDIKPGEFYSGNTIGVLLMLGATACYGLSGHLTKKYLTGLSVLTISLFTLVFSTIIGLIMMIVLSPQSFGVFSKIEVILPLLGLGSLGSGIAYLLYYYLVQKGSAEFAALVTYLVPVSAIIWGVLLLKEEIHMSMIVGLLIIFVGIYISSMKVKENKKKAAVA
ncbi:DMT family transporter [Bacillus sp. 31A1R]|uniref:DMT family transporter n=1 Tax=Robertmurraya mangrovi TaxID=3098077 RepID=A0ABU5ITZ7_9BACI|nr:DMT family transporter [Bacillus sp. 31A1R]MDZ5470619.1 DMT family transporter [Bacillus sp. 31A1R]